MSIPGKLLIALIAAAISASLFTFTGVEVDEKLLFVACCLASVTAVLLSHRALPMPAGLAASGASPKPSTASARDSSSKDDSASSSGASMEDGTVKWFNSNKGFGFIIRENGEEIFVHHRSVQGDARRGMRDGAAVRFAVVKTPKGPQAENVSVIA